MLTNIAARWIDDVRQECNLSNHQIFYLVKTRAISALVFPIFALIDTIAQTGLTLKDLGLAAGSTGEQRKVNLLHAKEHAALARKCFDGMLFSPVSLIYSDICSRHFIPPRQENLESLDPMDSSTLKKCRKNDQNRLNKYKRSSRHLQRMGNE